MQTEVTGSIYYLFRLHMFRIQHYILLYGDRTRGHSQARVAHSRSTTSTLSTKLCCKSWCIVTRSASSLVRSQREGTMEEEVMGGQGRKQQWD